MRMLQPDTAGLRRILHNSDSSGGPVGEEISANRIKLKLSYPDRQGIGTMCSSLRFNI